MESFTKHTGIVAPLDRADVDTDQIIPKQFLKRVERTGYGEYLFWDWRMNSDGTERLNFVLNKVEYAGASILVARENFGCGSSREHAVWAIQQMGVGAVISSSFADIFRNNALKNGLVPVNLDTEMHQSLFDLIEEVPTAELTIDLASQSVTLPNGATLSFPIDNFSKNCLLSGIDQLGYILSHEARISAYEAA